MKKIFLLLSICLVSTRVFAGEPTTLQLNLPAYWEKQVCPSPIWKNQTAVWKGITDNRASQEVGNQEVGQENIAVNTSPELTEIFNSNFKKMFTACGLKLSESESEDTMNIAIDINEFYAGVEKKFITGKSKASSKITFTASWANGANKTIDVGYDLESKRIKRKSLRQLQDTLNELLAETVKQLFQSSQMRNLEQ